MLRVGIGTDKHRLAFNRKLILGGVHVPAPRGAVGHSDGDALTHAVIDALLGAAALGDIGHHFPDTDDRWTGASSLEMLASVVQKVRDAGCKPVNVDAVVHLEKPNLGRLKTEMAAALAGALGLATHLVNVKAKTGEGLGDVGASEAVEAFAVALVETTAK
jgi:2-C-methyl-D-erythritol 2,4-cyclodiphosphate synthase